MSRHRDAWRRVTALVASGVPCPQILTTIADEVVSLSDQAGEAAFDLGVIGRFDQGDAVTLVALSGDEELSWVPGVVLSPDVALVPTEPNGGEARCDIANPLELHQFVVEALDGRGFRATCCAPIIVGGRSWGCVAGAVRDERPISSAHTAVLADLAQLAGITIASHEERRETDRLRRDQAALGRLATLVASGAKPQEVLDSVPRELVDLIDADVGAMTLESAGVIRYEPDDSITVVSDWSAGDSPWPVGSNWPLDGNGLAARVLATGSPARIESYLPVEGPIAEQASARGVMSTLGAPIAVDGQLWGVLAVSSKDPHLLSEDTEARVTQFAELAGTAIASVQARLDALVLADDQAALRRVAILVASGAPPEAVFKAVSTEAAGLIDPNSGEPFIGFVGIARFEPDNITTVVAVSDEKISPFTVGQNVPTEGSAGMNDLYETGRLASVDEEQGVSAGEVDAALDDRSLSTRVLAPITVDGRPWGFVGAAMRSPTLPRKTEARVMDFAELTATAISSAQARGDLLMLAEEQAALRRVATLVARGAPAEAVLDSVSRELAHIVDPGTGAAQVHSSAVLRFETDGTVTSVAQWADEESAWPANSNWSLESDALSRQIFETGRPARMDDIGESRAGDSSALPAEVRSAVGAPILVEGQLWGLLAVAPMVPAPLPLNAESRVADFAELVATAIANLKARADLAASRTRIVTSSDQTRRRFERDLHDGAQQRLVSLVLELRAAEEMIAADQVELRGRMQRIVNGLAEALEGLRELSQGIHPAILAQGGLRPALKALARRSALPVDQDVSVEQRFDDRIEVAAYYVASEALANAVKHAKASVVSVRVAARDAWLDITVSDDGVGGANVDGGSGLIGLTDRVEALGGSIEVVSPVGAGTSVHVMLPTVLD